MQSWPYWMPGPAMDDMRGLHDTAASTADHQHNRAGSIAVSRSGCWGAWLHLILDDSASVDRLHALDVCAPHSITIAPCPGTSTVHVEPPSASPGRPWPATIVGAFSPSRLPGPALKRGSYVLVSAVGLPRRAAGAHRCAR